MEGAIKYRTEQSGFTLAELLIALALLGVVAAFTIPKVLQSVAEEDAQARLRDVVSAMEQSWYEQKMQNQQGVGGTLFESLQNKLNSVDSQPTAVDAANAPFNGLVPAHPCSAAAVGANQGWVQFHNGAVITGLTNTNATAVLTPVPWVGPQANSTYVLCIDSNGKERPNVAGADVFLGNFQQWSDFDNTADTDGLGISDWGKSFNWGNLNQRIYLQTGAPQPAPFDVPEARVGFWLVIK